LPLEFRNGFRELAVVEVRPGRNPHHPATQDHAMTGNAIAYRALLAKDLNRGSLFPECALGTTENRIAF